MKWLVLLLALMFSQTAATQTPIEAPATEDPDLVDLNQLLEAVKQGRALDARTNADRIEAFQLQGAEQQQLLEDAQDRQAQLEALSAQREAQFESNEESILDLENRLQERMGSLKELFGVLQQVASDSQAQMAVSLTQLEYPERTDFMIDFAGRMGQANRLPEISEIERVWFELMREMTASGQVVSGPRPVLTASGVEASRVVTRLGVFSVVSDGNFLKFVPETGRLLEYPRQPAARYRLGAEALADGGDLDTPVAIDPVRGQLLDVLTQTPNLSERVAQGGTIGFLIIGLGTAGVILAVARMLVLLWRGGKIHRQLKHLDEPSSDNALGRVILAAHADDIPDVDTLELRLGEAVLEEVPRINAYIPLLKIIAAVAPLMGLLGTVTGMILTFQAITLFGAGDPRLMAGGISQALITTVLGLCVAIPMLLLHNLVNMRARVLTDLLKHRAVALVAQRAEREANSAAS
jgi:biopolymer transport protein ExbB